MLLSLWLVPGRLFRPEYMSDLLPLLAVLNARLACLFVGATALRPSSACDSLVGALAVANPPVRRAGDDTSKSSSSSAPPRKSHFCNREEGSKRSVSAERKRRCAVNQRLPLVRGACTTSIH